ncbi:PKD domain-containing protein [Parvicella tangerina]|uniref:PKD/Chitinase domain-containing protein n=1 Tax=Parvicella tangerina TaxID=2829795 RepID=A0A916NGH8_9FLAO|nr:PKD domain-containing protein [Parvicella tangerina]CAG5079813.1 hypothetical protein CRYO30217_01079 [Parvicella tangerina]
MKLYLLQLITILVFTAPLKDIAAQSDSARIAQAEIGLKVYYTFQSTRDYVEDTYNESPLQFKMRHSRLLHDFSKNVIDLYVAENFDFDTIDSYFRNYLSVELPAGGNISKPDHFNNDSDNPFFTKAPNGPCVNMDFEEGTLNGWEMYEGDVNGNPAEIVNTTQIATPGAHHTIMTPGADPVVGIPTTNPNGGNFSLRLGDGTGTGARAASIRQTFLVDATNAVFTYSYAVVLEDPSGHTLGEKPFFKVNMYDQSGNPIACGEYQVVASSGLDASWTNYGAGWYRDWQTVFAPLDAYIGQNVTIEFISGDCDQSGHYGYAYVDAECSPLEIIPPGTLICDNNPVTLDAPAGAASYLWNTGSTNQSITTSTPGSYSVEVVPIQGAACSITINATVSGASGAPVADFSAVPTNVCVGETIDFTDLSTATNGAAVDYWDYNFGDGSVNASVADPSHTYAADGTYDVQFVAGVLVPGQGGCYDTVVQTVTVTPSPTAGFTNTTVCEGTATDFTDTSVDATGIATYEWDFTDDGTIDSPAQNPSFTYPTAGNYDATLIVTSNGGCTDTLTQSVTVNESALASFSQTDVCEGNTMSFNDLSSSPSGTITNWDWDFGDGTGTSIAQNPTYDYASAGSYDVVLSVQSTGGCSDDTTIAVNVYANPVADFVVDNVCDGETYDFVDSSNPSGSTITIWEWDYESDATVDFSGQNGSNLYSSAGNYDVTLYVETQEGCSNSVTQTVEVYDLPVADFTAAQECQGTSIQFTDQSSSTDGTITNWDWDFQTNGSIDNTQQNPSHVMGAAGSYTTTLTVTTDLGCTDDFSSTVVVDPLPTADYAWSDVCDGNAMSFTDNSSVASGSITNYQWDFGDFTGSSTNQNASYTYTGSGTYDVVLAVTTDQGCVGSQTYTVEVFENPVVAFTYADECDGDAVSFADNSNIYTATSATYDWDFTSDGTTDFTGLAIDHTYPSDGSYFVTLSVLTSEGCTGEATEEVVIHPLPIPAFTGQNLCQGSTVDFTNTSSISSGSIVSQFWDFGNGNTSAALEPSETFGAEGVYNVVLETTSDQGCAASTSSPIEVYPIPNAQFITADVCDESNVSFTDFSNVSNTYTTNSIVSWDWDFGTTPATGAQGQFANHTYDGPGTYTVTLDVETNRGCTDSYQYDVTVYPNPEVSFESPNPDGCTEWCPTINNTSSIASGTNSSYLWNMGDGTVLTDENPAHCFTNTSLVDVSYTVSLTVTSDFGCTTSLTESDFITVYPEPVAEFSHDPIVGDIYNPTIEFTNESLIADLNSWNFDDLGSSTEEHPTFTFPDQDSGIYEVCLYVETFNGCTNYVCHNVEIEGYSNIFVPNAFTPDDDGINDLFQPSVFGFSEEGYELMVFDRWGLLIYSSTSLQGAWDGTYKGQPCLMDTYVWKIKATDKYTGEDKSFLGHINLIR